MGMVMEYDLGTDKWTRKGDMPQLLHHVALAEAGGRVYMFRGFTLPGKGKAAWVPVNQAWEYDPRADKWRALAPLPSARALPTPST
jgi:Kelch motif